MPTPQLSPQHIRDVAAQLAARPDLTETAALFLGVFAELLEHGIEAAHTYYFDRVEPF